MGRAVGIDLGTTYSAVAWVDEYGKPVILKNADGQVTPPSVVFVDLPNSVVGETALQSTITETIASRSSSSGTSARPTSAS